MKWHKIPPRKEVQAKIDQLLIWWLETRCEKIESPCFRKHLREKVNEVFLKLFQREAACIVGEINIIKSNF